MGYPPPPKWLNGEMVVELPFDAWRRKQGYETPAGRELAQYDASFDAWIAAETDLTFEEWIQAMANPPKPSFPPLRDVR